MRGFDVVRVSESRRDDQTARVAPSASCYEVAKMSDAFGKRRQQFKNGLSLMLPSSFNPGPRSPSHLGFSLSVTLFLVGDDGDDDVLSKWYKEGKSVPPPPHH